MLQRRLDMKLSKAQQEVMNKAKAQIDFARTHTVFEWAQEKTHTTNEDIERMVSQADLYYSTPEKMRKSLNERIERYVEQYSEYYERERRGEVLTHCNSKTLEKLEKMGLIEIEFDSKGYGGYGIDRVKILNY